MPGNTAHRVRLFLTIVLNEARALLPLRASAVLVDAHRLFVHAPDTGTRIERRKKTSGAPYFTVPRWLYTRDYKIIAILGTSLVMADRADGGMPIHQAMRA